jgi:ABC-2 type transport system permease protein
MNLRIILAIAYKDIVDAIKNTYIFVSLLLPVGMSLLFGLIMPGPASATQLDVFFLGPGEQQLAERLQANPGINLVRKDTEDAVNQAVMSGNAVGIILPEGFDSALAGGETPVVRILYNGDTGAAEEAGVQRIVENALRVMAGQTLPATIDLVDLGGGAETSGPAFDYSHYLLVLFLVMGLVVTGVFVVPTILVEEKEKHTLEAILSTPASYPDLVAGKALLGLAYSLLSALVLLLLNRGFTGNPVITIAAVVLGALFLVLAGLLLGAVFKTSGQVNTWSTIVMLVLLLPVMFTSILHPPASILFINSLIPTKYIADTLNLSLGNQATLVSAGSNLLILAGCGAAAFGIVVWVLRRERL